MTGRGRRGGMRTGNKPHGIRTWRALLIAVTTTALAGCGGLPSERKWGESAVYPVKWKRVAIAAKNAALDPFTYVPLAGAAVIAVGDFDHRISDWAVENNPIFGSEQGARDFSDVARDVLVGEGIGTMFLTPSGPGAKEWTFNKARGAVVGASGLLLTDFATSQLKDAVGRTRPDDSSDQSMPSGHTSASFAGATLANRNLDYIEMNRYARTGLKAANMTLAASVGWARVEGEKHFPTDVLVGAALGNFLTRFIYDAFIGLDEEDSFSFYLEPAMDGGKVSLSWSF